MPNIRLTAREREVARLVAGGQTNKEIARTLGVTPATAKWHVSQILTKLGLQGRVQLAVYAHDHLSLTPASQV
jgi:DNA-binding NarL/FixJ family response regulator